MQKVSLIACIGKDRGLGQAGQLLWRIPEDQKFFKDTTMGGAVAMGRKTFESIGNPLPGRVNIVLSHEPVEAEGVYWCQSRQDLEKFLATRTEPIFIIGGASLYQMYLSRAEKIYLTEVDSVRPADVFFPEFNPADFRRHVLSQGVSDGIAYEIVEYVRKV